MRKSVIGILLACVLFACSQPVKYDHPHVIIKTGLGNIELELYEDKAPKTVAAFLAHIDSGYYENTTFYRVLKPENQPSDAFKARLIQGGLWQVKNKLARTLPGIPHETTQQTGILHKTGIISMARAEPGTATTEFFICLSDQPGFDYGGKNNADGLGYAAFGKVVKGMGVVKEIYGQPFYNQSFDPPVYIFNIVRLR
ncbi:MAG: peptidylprolyl isomerase [Ilyomonas sp.]